MALPKIPINIKTLTKVGQVFESESNTDTVIEVLVDTSASRALVTLSRTMLMVRPNYAGLTVSSFGDQMPTLNKDADLIVVVAGTSDHLRRILEITLWSEMRCVVFTEDASALLAAVPEEDAVEIAKTIIEVDVEAPAEALEHAFAQWCISHLPDLRMTLGAAFPFMRRAVAGALTQQTSLENAVIAAVFFLPGADMPLLTLNQSKLLYQIAVVNEIPLTRERLADVALIVVAAFGLRGFTRLALRRMLPVGWLVRGAISFGATLAIGHLAHEMYSHGGGIVELVQEKMGNKPPETSDLTLLEEVRQSGAEQTSEAT